MLTYNVLFAYMRNLIISYAYSSITRIYCSVFSQPLKCQGSHVHINLLCGSHYYDLAVMTLSNVQHCGNNICMLGIYVRMLSLGQVN